MLNSSTRIWMRLALHEPEVLAEHQVELRRIRSAQVVARQVPERPGLGRRERRRVQPAYAVLQVRIDARDEIRSLRAAAVPARDVRDRDAVDRRRCPAG